MSDPRAVERLLAPMREREVDVTQRRYSVNRDAVIGRMLRASHAAPAPASWSRVVPALALAAAIALLVAGVGWFAGTRNNAPAASLQLTTRSGEVHQESGGARSAIGAGAKLALAPGVTIETSRRGDAELRTATGQSIELLENTRVAVLDARPGKASTLRLERGRVRCVVPRLEPGETFTIITPDARIEDLGTVFSVSVSGSGADAKTAVHVEQGVVVVHHQSATVRLTQRQSWQVSSAPAPEPQAAVQAPERADAPAGSATPRTVAARRPLPAKKPAQTLDLETELLRSGLAEERAGNLRAAAASFEKLLSRHPSSPLAPDARAALQRVRGSIRHEQ
jgi:hypothetical protein